MRASRIAVLLALLLPALASPCGPDFPLEFLSKRDETLATLPDGAFLLEAPRLVNKPADTLPLVGEEPQGARDGGGAKERALYAAASAAWKANRATSAPKFDAVLALPEAERRRFTIPAHYALAVVGAATESVAHYQALRDAQKKGFEDVFGLAVASYGEEALRALWEKDDAKAIGLYATQASYGSESGGVSLLFVARQLATDEQRLKRALKDPLVQRLMALYAWTRGTETWGETGAPSTTLVDTLTAIPNLAGADRLAAALYRQGQFEKAALFVDKESTPLAHWVRAKLALRVGKADVAEAELEKARAGFDLSEQWTPPYSSPLRPRQQLEVELSILRLAKGDFDGAMTHALESCSWMDLSYLAERVLTVDELQKTVDGLGGKPRCVTAEPGDESSDPSGYWVPRDATAALRELLARRLLRTGQFARALPFFSDALRPLAQRYGEALTAAASLSAPEQKAAKLFEAAQALRGHGMELLGTEAAPDWSWTRGEFDPMWTDPDEPAAPRDAGVSAAEQQRVAASAPAFPQRFHYRAVTSKLLEDAAELMPPRSQAYAALLCASARLSIDRDPEHATALWLRYVKHGALLTQPMTFGRQCPEPSFAPKPFKWPKVRKRTVALVALPVLLLVAGVIALRRRRRSAS